MIGCIQRTISLVNNAVSSFEVIWEEKDNYDKIIKEKKHSELLVDLIYTRYRKLSSNNTK